MRRKKEFIKEYWRNSLKLAGIIGILTDFGEEDEYVAAVKGVILKINPNVKIIDISHYIPPQDVVKAAFLLSSISPHFPEKSIFLTVVDPGVGTSRRILVIETKSNKYFVGPDNGVLSLPAEKEGINRIISVENTKFFLKNISSTFHGRDIMAPVAAHISLGVPIENFGPEIKDFQKLDIPAPKIGEDAIYGQVMLRDHFGNLITNIDKNTAEKHLRFDNRYDVKIGSRIIKARFLKTYGEGRKGEVLLIVGSKNLLEISINQGNAFEELKIKVGSGFKILL